MTLDKTRNKNNIKNLTINKKKYALRIILLLYKIFQKVTVTEYGSYTCYLKTMTAFHYSKHLYNYRRSL